jgi:CubicO group peptidase (beta-lactamase class C family)
MRHRSIAAVLATSSLILASCGSETGNLDRDSSTATTAATDFVARVEAVRKQAKALAALAPGVIVSVRDGNDRKTLAIGFATRNPERAIMPQDTVMIASVTKALVATAALSLAQDGSLRLDDTVEKWLPGLLPKGRQIKVEHLLSMSSGLPNYEDSPRLSGTGSAASYGAGRSDRRATARLRAGNAGRAVEHQLRGAPTDP